VAKVDVRSITPDEVNAYRRAIRAGFGTANTVDDDEWAAATSEPLDRCLATFDKETIVATLRSFPTTLTVPGGAGITVGALTAVTCRATHRRRGVLTRMIGDDLRASRDRGEPADILIAAEYPIYGRFGYGPATQRTDWEVDVKAASTFTEGGVGTVEFVDNDAFRKEAPSVFERVRVSRPGMISRDDLHWDVRADLRRRPEEKPWEGFRVLCRDDDGVAQGYASYTVKDKWADFRPRSTVEVAELCAAVPGAEARLWRFLTELDLIATITASDRPVDELLPWLLVDGRAAKETGRNDFVWVRPLDVPALLTARTYTATGRVALEVVDDQGLAGGRFALDVSPGGATCTPTRAAADLTMPIRTLGAVALGGPRVAMLHAAGWLDEHTPGSVMTADAVFAGTVVPWCNTWF
jgi:predicted acetyltransferase